MPFSRFLPTLPPPRGLLPPLLLGASGVFGFAPFYLYPVPVLALAALLHMLREQDARAALAGGYAFGLGWFLAGVSWVYVSMHDVGGMPAPLAALAVLLFAAFLAVFPAAALGLAARLGRDAGSRWLWLAPALWALADWTRGWIFTGFPWQALGFSQVPHSPLAGYAPLLGVYGVTWLAAWSAAALASHRARMVGLAALLWLGGWGLAQVPWTRPEGPPLSVALLQGNIAQELKFRPEKLRESLDTYRRLTLDSRARLIVLPETALPIFLEDVPLDYLLDLAGHAAVQDGGHGGLLLGVPERQADGRYFNSVVALSGAHPQVYRKVHLVPFGEFVPWGFRWFIDLMHIPLGDFSRGAPGQPPMRAAGQMVAVNICYEDVFGEELIHALPEATLMANLSNDAWFGDSHAPWQHLQISQMRALETGRWWLRANNTGITAILDEKGRVVRRLAPFSSGVLHGEAQGMRGLTPYARWGNTGFLGLAALVLLTALWRCRRRTPGRSGA